MSAADGRATSHSCPARSTFRSPELACGEGADSRHWLECTRRRRIGFSDIAKKLRIPTARFHSQDICCTDTKLKRLAAELTQLRSVMMIFFANPDCFVLLCRKLLAFEARQRKAPTGRFVCHICLHQMCIDRGVPWKKNPKSGRTVQKRASTQIERNIPTATEVPVHTDFGFGFCHICLHQMYMDRGVP